MPSVETFSPGDMFIFRLFQQSQNEPDLPFSTVYEVYANEAGTISDLESLAGKIRDFHKALQGTFMYITKCEVATWEVDSHPYNPLSFVNFEYGLTSGVVEIETPLPVRVCWALRRGVTTGRSGKIYVRGALDETDVYGGGSAWGLQDPAALATRLSFALTTSGLGAYVDPTGANIMSLALIGQPKGAIGVQHRRLKSITSHGAVDVQMNHRWYNRKATA